MEGDGIKTKNLKNIDEIGTKERRFYKVKNWFYKVTAERF
jgi:hypothetical protein